MPTPSDALALALAHHHAGRLQEAEQIYRQILAAEPNNAEALNNLGNVFADRGLLTESLPYYERALAPKPDFVEAHYNRGNALKGLGNLDAAASCYRTVIRLRPSLVDAHYNLGMVLHEQGRYPDEALDCFQRALALDPGLADAHNSLGIIFREMGRLEDAIKSYRNALELNPVLANAYCGLGVVHFEQGHFDQAETYLRQAIAINPQYAEAWDDLGVAIQEQGRLAEAAVCFNRAIDSDPNHARAHVNRAMLSLTNGAFAEGWAEYEWRWRCKGFALPPFTRPRWQGQKTAGKTLLLFAEQGIGDTIQFIRYASVLKQQGATVFVLCPDSLKNLLTTCRSVDHVFGSSDKLPNFDYYAPLLSVPRLLGTDLDSIPADVPYLSADPGLVLLWRDRLTAVRGYRVGINWQGRPGTGLFRKRDIRLSHFSAIAKVPGVELVSLQKGAGRSQIDASVCEFHVVDPGNDVDETHGAFMDTTAIMRNIDLVITSDTSAAHLAGALGVPVWVALPYVADWRWLLNRTNSPWYPTMRLFRQKRCDNWAGVFDEIAVSLTSLVIAKEYES